MMCTSTNAWLPMVRVRRKCNSRTPGTVMIFSRIFSTRSASKASSTNSRDESTISLSPMNATMMPTIAAAMASR